MKKVVCLLLCVILTGISAVSFAAVSYSLPEKMQKQLEIGSGLKGTVTLHSEGNSPVVLALHPFQDVELQFRSLRSGNQMHAYLYQAGENEEQKGLTEFFNDGNNLYFRSDLLQDNVLTLPAVDQMIDLMRSPEGGNPSAASMLYRWAQLSGEKRDSLLNGVMEVLSSPLEIWLAQYATASEVHTLENGTSAVDLNYTIPMADLKTEMVELYALLLQRSEGQALMDALMSEEQRKVYANENLLYYYREALDAMNNDYDIAYSRTVSTLGQTISSSLELPLDSEKMNCQALLIENANGLTSYTLRGEDQLITIKIAGDLNLQEIDSFSVWIETRPNPASENQDPAAYHALRADLKHSVELTSDEESRDHQREVWHFHTERDVSRLTDPENADLYPEETPLDLDLNLHYFSRYSQSSPTTLEFQLKYDADQLNLTLSGQLKTASPWVFTPFKTDNAVNLMQMTSQERELKLAEFLASAAEQLTLNLPAQSEPEDSETAEEKKDETDPETTETEKPESDAAESAAEEQNAEDGKEAEPDVEAEEGQNGESDKDTGETENSESTEKNPEDPEKETAPEGQESDAA